MSVYLKLCYEFFKTGLFALGGGPATLPFLLDMADRYPWFTRSQLADMIAISESTPGPLGINTATYAGFHAAGVLGSLAATLSLVFPSLVIIMIIAKFLQNFSENRIVKSVFYGIRPAVTGLIAAAVFGLFQIALFTETNGTTTLSVSMTAVCASFFVLMNLRPLKKLHPIVWLLGGAAIGIIAKL